jgi:hypothetical protein
LRREACTKPVNEQCGAQTPFHVDAEHRRDKFVAAVMRCQVATRYNPVMIRPDCIFRAYKRAGARLGGEGAGFPIHPTSTLVVICLKLLDAAESRLENHLIEDTL